MNPAGKTIQIYLPTGDPSGLRLAEITTRIVQVIEVPRAQLEGFQARHEASEVGVYFLISREETGDLQVYVGETEDLGKRIGQHHAKKEFWERALCVISRTQSLTKTHVRFLEWLCVEKIKKAGRCKLVNATVGTKPHASEALQADIFEVFDTAKTLLTTLGYPLFDPLLSVEIKTDDSTRFRCKGPGGADGTGYLTNEGFVVLKGSVGRAKPSKSADSLRFHKRRDALVSANKLEEQAVGFVFLDNVLFGSPSAAATMVLARRANGWVQWKRDDGRSLDEVYRAD